MGVKTAKRAKHAKHAKKMHQAPNLEQHAKLPNLKPPSVFTPSPNTGEGAGVEG